MKRIPEGTFDKPEAPEIKDVLPFLEAWIEFGRNMEIGRLQ